MDETEIFEKLSLQGNDREKIASDFLSVTSVFLSTNLISIVVWLKI